MTLMHMIRCNYSASFVQSEKFRQHESRCFRMWGKEGKDNNDDRMLDIVCIYVWWRFVFM